MGALYRELWPQAGCADCWVPGPGLSVPKSAWKWAGLRARVRRLPVATICGTHSPERDSPFQEFRSSVLQKFSLELCSGASTSSGWLFLEAQAAPVHSDAEVHAWLQPRVPGPMPAGRCREAAGASRPIGALARRRGVTYLRPHSSPPGTGCVIIRCYRWVHRSSEPVRNSPASVRPVRGAAGIRTQGSGNLKAF